MSLKIYLLRHGETSYSQNGTYCGSIDPGLTVEGSQMAQAFANTYKCLSWVQVFVSPQQRAISTAQPLCDVINLPMQIKNGLREINYGAWEGRTQEDVQLHHGEEYIRWLTEPAWNPPTNGETAIQVTNRSLPIITDIESSYKTGNVLVVSHKATIRIIICNLMGIDVGRYRDRINVPAGSVSVVKFDSHGPILEILGDRNYMPTYLRERKGT